MNYHIYYERTTGEKVQTIARATAVPTNEDVVCYQELYGDFEFFVMSRDEFLKRFTKEFAALPKKLQPLIEERGRITEKTKYIEDMQESDDLEIEKQTEQDIPEGADADLIRFLDADTYREKIKIFLGMKEKLDEHLLNNIAVSLDLTLEDDVDAFEFILSHMEMQKRYEKDRLR
jgi:isopenicillin N synthase-like dioxygenase